MTPSMLLSSIKASYSGHSESVETVHRDLERAFTLGHQFGLDRAAEIADLESAKRIKNLKVEMPQAVATIDEDFL